MKNVIKREQCKLACGLPNVNILSKVSKFKVLLYLLFSPLGHPRFQVSSLTRLHSACCSSLIPSITLWDKDDFGET